MKATCNILVIFPHQFPHQPDVIERTRSSVHKVDVSSPAPCDPRLLFKVRQVVHTRFAVVPTQCPRGWLLPWASEVRVRRAQDGTSAAHALVLSSLVCCLTHIPSQAVGKAKAKAAAKAKGVGAFTLRDLPTRSSRWASSSTRAKAT